VEAIASQNPKELTAMIEKISGSEELKDRYNELLTQKDELEENTIYNYNKKKGINAEKKQFKAQKEEAERYQQLMQMRVSL
jgi:structural maintenance of chromosome 1